MKRPALQNKQVVVLRLAFRARKVLGTFEKRAPGVRFPDSALSCGSSLLLVLFSAPRVVSSGTPIFPSPKKTNTSKFQLDPECSHVDI